MSHVDEIKEKLQVIKPELSRRFHVSSLGLFGSILRSDFSAERSDVDILVDFSQPIGIEFVDLAEFLENYIERKVDLVSRSGIKDKYFSQIESQILYV